MKYSIKIKANEKVGILYNFNKMTRLTNSKKSYVLSSKKAFEQELHINNTSIRTAFDFAYKMAPKFHREYRTGGGHIRTTNEIFVNTFTGKLSEFALYEYLLKYDIVVDVPDTRIYPRNVWDQEDLIATFNVESIYRINVKSTKHFGHLMLLEKGDYDKNGVYIPDGSTSDFYVLVRLQFDLESKLKSLRQLYNNKLIEEKKLKGLVNQVIREVKLQDSSSNQMNNKIYYDIPGYITHEDLIYIINNGFLIEKGEYLRNTRMDASNYYIQSGDFRPLENLINLYN